MSIAPSRPTLRRPGNPRLLLLAALIPLGACATGRGPSRTAGAPACHLSAEQVMRAELHPMPGSGLDLPRPEGFEATPGPMQLVHPCGLRLAAIETPATWATPRRIEVAEALFEAMSHPDDPSAVRCVRRDDDHLRCVAGADAMYARRLDGAVILLDGALDADLAFALLDRAVLVPARATDAVRATGLTIDTPVGMRLDESSMPGYLVYLEHGAEDPADETKAGLVVAYEPDRVHEGRLSPSSDEDLGAVLGEIAREDFDVTAIDPASVSTTLLGETGSLVVGDARRGRETVRVHLLHVRVPYGAFVAVGVVPLARAATFAPRFEAYARALASH